MKNLIIIILSLFCSLISAQETKLHPVQIHQSGATDNQVLSWDGSKWMPATISGTDNQNLNISNDTLYLERGGFIVLTPYKNIQNLSFNSTTGVLSISNGNNVTLKVGELFITENKVIASASPSITLLNSVPNENLGAVFVFRNGLAQRTPGDFTLSGTTVTFSRALDTGEFIVVKYPK